MKVFIVIISFIAIILFLIFILLLTRLYFQVFVEYKNYNITLQFQIRFWKVFRINREMTYKSKDLLNQIQEVTEEEMEDSKQTVSWWKKAKTFMQSSKEFLPIIKNFLRKVVIHDLNWKTSIGFKDASMTGIISGLLWSLKGDVFALLSHFMKVKQDPIILVEPYFHKRIMETSFSCMISFKIGHAILAILKMIRIKGKDRENPTNISLEEQKI